MWLDRALRKRQRRARPPGLSLGSVLVLEAEGSTVAASDEVLKRSRIPANGDDMGVVVYVVLTVAIFAVLGLVQKLVEGL